MRGGPPPAGPPTGRTLPPRSATLAATRRWTGGTAFLGPLGRIDVPPPLAVLELTPAGLVVRGRPGRLFGAPPVTIPAGPDTALFPVRARLPGLVGVAIRPPRSTTFIFWTSSPAAVLDAAEAAGFRPSRRECRPTLR